MINIDLHPQDKRDFIVKQIAKPNSVLRRVQMEEAKEYKYVPVPIPKYVKPKVEKRKLGWLVFFKQIIP